MSLIRPSSRSLTHAVQHAACVLGGLLLLWGLAGSEPLWAQQKIGYIDSDYILQQVPEYATAQQTLDRLEQQWEEQLQEQEQEIEQMKEEFQARELLYTEEERKQRRQSIRQAEQELQQLRKQYFGPEGQLYQRQRELLRPIQERVFEAVQEIATAEGYDYVFDKSGDYMFMYTRAQYDLSDEVLRELGIDVENSNKTEQ